MRGGGSGNKKLFRSLRISNLLGENGFNKVGVVVLFC